MYAPRPPAGGTLFPRRSMQLVCDLVFDRYVDSRTHARVYYSPFYITCVCVCEVYHLKKDQVAEDELDRLRRRGSAGRPRRVFSFERSLFMPIVYDDRELINNAATAAKETKNYNKAKKEQEKLDKKIADTIAKDQKKKNRQEGLNYLLDNTLGKLDGTPAGNMLDALSDATRGTNYLNNPLYTGLSSSNPSVTSASGSGSSSSGKSGRASGSGSVGSAPASGASSVTSYDDIMNKVNQTAMSNNEWSAQQAQIERDWELQLSNTAHQREVADLKAAGLNPVLSAGGSGASTPSVSLPQVDNSNTRILAEVALAGLEATASTAKSLGGSRRSKTSSTNTTSSLIGKVLTSGAQGLARSIGYSIGRGLFG